MQGQSHCQACGRVPPCGAHPGADTVRFSAAAQTAYETVKRLDQRGVTLTGSPDLQEYTQSLIAEAVFWGRQWGEIRELPPIQPHPQTTLKGGVYDD